MLYAFDAPITRYRAAVLSKARPADRKNIPLKPEAAERVWAWDSKNKRLQVFLKPNSYAERDHKNFVSDFGDRPDEAQWDIVISPSVLPRYIRKFVRDSSLFKDLDWVDLTST